MEAEMNFSAIAPAVFNGDNYQLWAVRMETYLEALDLWEAVEEDYEIPALPNNPTMAQLKSHKEKKTKKSKAKACLFAAVSSTIFTRIMSLKSAKGIWDYLKNEYEGDERIKGMQILNLIREFELQRMKESETIKDYSDKLLSIANKVRLLGSEFTDSRIVEKILVTVPERYEATITALENTKDLSKISLAELLNALQAQEQRRSMRENVLIEEALAAKQQSKTKWKKKNSGENTPNSEPENGNGEYGNQKKTYPPCQHCGKKGHPPFKCWRRPEAECTICHQKGHEQVICYAKNQQSGEAANTVNQEEEDQLFVATCVSSDESCENWLIDSGCTNHMTYNKQLFRDMSSKINSKVRVGDGKYISVHGKGTVAISTYSGTKLISDVLYVPDINQNLLSIGQLMKKGFKVIFEDCYCIIKDASGRELFKVKEKGGSFILNLIEEEHFVFQAKENVIEVCHYHPQELLKIKSKEMEKYIPELDDCVLNQACRASTKLQFIHTNIAGPQRTPSLKGSLYYAAFTDDFTRMCWNFFLKYKSEEAQVFWKFKAMVENESGCKIKTLRSDIDWGGSVDDMKSTSGFCFTLGSGVFPWSSKKQEIVAQSKTEDQAVDVFIKLLSAAKLD
uniref:Putative gag-pol polyprotein n=1 Tax=Torenia fournieri TaxID=68875 RepID=A0A809RKS4_9LAMI|nr:putative gag-pol polyprotein [Torenia fournieri]